MPTLQSRTFPPTDSTEDERRRPRTWSFEGCPRRRDGCDETSTSSALGRELKEVHTFIRTGPAGRSGNGNGQDPNGVRLKPADLLLRRGRPCRTTSLGRRAALRLYESCSSGRPAMLR